jgi:hypothetical protein
VELRLTTPPLGLDSVFERTERYDGHLHVTFLETRRPLDVAGGTVWYLMVQSVLTVRTDCRPTSTVQAVHGTRYSTGTGAVRTVVGRERVCY